MTPPSGISLALGFLLGACSARPASHEDAAIDGRPSILTDASPLPAVTITATVGSTRFVTREHMLAAGEMQISGEPLAEAMGRDLGGYSRDLIPPDIYLDPHLGIFWIDLAGFSTGIESYEYSKQPMNSVAFESGAGTSLVYGPLVDTDGATGPAATAHLAAQVAHFAAGSGALDKWVFPADHALGWPGIWPTAHVYRSFDPAIDPTSAEDLRCTISSDDDPSESGGALISADYECDATTLHLRDRDAQLDRTITPGADGFTTWKYGLWVLNYLQIMHAADESAVETVPESELAHVGEPGNAVGVYLGSSYIEGFQAQMFLAAIDNRAEDWLTRLTTTDGAALSGFPSVASALAYDHAAPLRWFPGAIAVTETDDGSGFPRPSYALASADSDLMDLIGVAMGHAEIYALTDTRNRGVGGAQAARVFFDGDPFAADDQRADGDPTLHDRALAMMRVALVDLDRLHTDPASKLLVDRVTMTGAAPSRGHTIATTSVAYTLIGLRTVRRALGSQLELYSNNTPDTAITSTPLDALPLRFPGDPALSFSARLAQIIDTHARLLYDHLTDASGRAYDGWDVAAGAPTDALDTLDAHTAAIRGLFAAYLATGDVRYRERAIAVFARVEAVFHDPIARIYAATPAPVDAVEYTPMRFALLQSALRDVYELVATRPGGEALVPIVEARLGRLNKLVLNGWDDRDRDRRVSGPGECVSAPDGPPRGGLQMAERTLTGETGRFKDEGTGGGPPTLDRDGDCVPEIDDAHLPAALADSITFEIARP